MNIEQEIRAQIEKNKGLKLAVGEINNHLSILEGLLRNERDDVQKQVDEAYQKGYDKGYADKTNNDEVCKKLAKDIQDEAYQRGINDGSLDAKQRVEGAYKKGYDAGIIASSFVDKSDEAYQKGLADAWEAARKIFGYEIDGGIPIDKMGGVFGYSEDATFCTADIIRHNTASEAIEKLKAYEEKKKQDDEIKVGDEVDCSGDSFIVTRIFQPYNKAEKCDGVDMDGCTYHDVLISGLTKTGRHVDIEGILSEMRE